MRSRIVSPHFLSEIDKFLDAHPEIARFQPDFAYHVNHPRPLHGYRFFVQGYTKPARYIDGVSRVQTFPVPQFYLCCLEMIERFADCSKFP